MLPLTRHFREEERQADPDIVELFRLVTGASDCLSNPLHPASADIAARKLRLWTYDPRLTKAP